MFLGEDFLAWMLLALGAAMAVGNLAALILPHPDKRLLPHPPRPDKARLDKDGHSRDNGGDSDLSNNGHSSNGKDGELSNNQVKRATCGEVNRVASKAYVLRCCAFILLGVVAAVWASVSILAT